MEAKDNQTINQKSMYVALTRARNEAIIITNKIHSDSNNKGLVDMLTDNDGLRISALEALKMGNQQVNSIDKSNGLNNEVATNKQPSQQQTKGGITR